MKEHVWLIANLFCCSAALNGYLLFIAVPKMRRLSEMWRRKCIDIACAGCETHEKYVECISQLDRQLGDE